MKRVMSPLRYPGSKVRITEMVAGLFERTSRRKPPVRTVRRRIGCVARAARQRFRAVCDLGRARSDDLRVLENGKGPARRPDRPHDERTRHTSRVAPDAAVRDVDKPTKANIADLGYAGLFFNRTCFSGIVGAGPIGGMAQSSSYKIDCRFNKKELASAIRTCSGILNKIEIVFGDGIAFLEKQCLEMPPHSVVYIDPPYVTNGYKLYRYHFDKAQHERLADALGNLRVPWLMSYDNHSLIRELYVGEQAKYVKTYQSLKGSRFVKEILLLSDDFALPAERTEPTPSNRGRGPSSELRGGIKPVRRSLLRPDIGAANAR